MTKCCLYPRKWTKINENLRILESTVHPEQNVALTYCRCLAYVRMWISDGSQDGRHITHKVGRTTWENDCLAIDGCLWDQHSIRLRSFTLVCRCLDVWCMFVHSINFWQAWVDSTTNSSSRKFLSDFGPILWRSITTLDLMISFLIISNRDISLGGSFHFFKYTPRKLFSWQIKFFAKIFVIKFFHNL